MGCRAADLFHGHFSSLAPDCGWVRGVLLAVVPVQRHCFRLSILFFGFVGRGGLTSDVTKLDDSTWLQASIDLQQNLGPVLNSLGAVSDMDEVKVVLRFLHVSIRARIREPGLHIHRNMSNRALRHQQ